VAAVRESNFGVPIQQQSPIIIQQQPVIMPAQTPQFMGIPGIVQQMNPGVVIPTAPVVPPGQSVTQVPVEESGSAPFGALLVTERTQKGFEADLLPEMTRMLGSGTTREQVAAEIRGLVAQAFTAKNHLYNILIRHQSTFETDEEYRSSLEKLVQAWVTDTADGV